MLAALSTQSKFVLAGMGAIFIVFSLVAALMIPRTRPQFPGAGLRVFLLATVVLFVSMMLAVEFFAVEEEEEAHAAQPGGTVEVAGTEFQLDLTQTEFAPGKYAFELVNEGRSGHNLVVNGPRVRQAATPVIEPDEKATLRVDLVAGEYELYCSVPGHREAGMRITISVK